MFFPLEFEQTYACLKQRSRTEVMLNPGSGRYSGERNGNSLQYSCLGNPMDRGAWWAIVRVSKELDKTATTTYNNMLTGGDRCSRVRTTSEM